MGLGPKWCRGGLATGASTGPGSAAFSPEEPRMRRKSDLPLLSKSLCTAWMAAVAGQFHGAARIAAVLAAILTVLQSLTFACRV